MERKKPAPKKPVCYRNIVAETIVLMGVCVLSTVEATRHVVAPSCLLCVSTVTPSCRICQLHQLRGFSLRCAQSGLQPSCKVPQFLPQTLSQGQTAFVPFEPCFDSLNANKIRFVLRTYFFGGWQKSECCYFSCNIPQKRKKKADWRKLI